MAQKKTVAETNLTTSLQAVFEDIAVIQENTVLQYSTLKNVESELDAYLYTARTGVQVMETIRFPWNKVFAAANTSVENLDRKKVMIFVEKQLEDWIKTRPVSASGGSALEPEFAKEMPKILHSILKSAGNKMKIDGLATAYALKTERGLDGETLAHISGQIRAYTYTDPNFSIGKGGMASVYRLADEKGKETGVEVAEAAPGTGPKDSKVLERFTKTAKSLGFTSKSQFVTARNSGAVTIGDLRTWLTKHKAS